VFGYSGDVPPELHVTALGNEGFLVEVGSSTVIVDGLYRGLRGYVAPTEQQLRARERAEPPFDVMDLVLATHHHPDHFDAKVVASHLKSNPRAVIVTTPMAVELIRGNAEQFRSISKRVRAVFPAEGETEDVEIDRIHVEVLNLHHGRNRSLPAENLGFVVEMNGFSFLHIGDTMATAEELVALGLSDREIDIAFVPFWHLLDAPGAQKYLVAIGAPTVVAMHLPAADAPPSYLDPASNLEDLICMVEETAPGVLVFTDVMEEREIRTGD
jgi:L-ascorbate metabolism protein UlaG (beta-lactamase superfamily)